MTGLDPIIYADPRVKPGDDELGAISPIAKLPKAAGTRRQTLVQDSAASYLRRMGASTEIAFERVLLPHRSLPPRGFHVLMLLLGLVSLVVGIVFVSIGAWPIFGFFGLDVALLYLAFRLSYRSARQREILRLAADDFTVERIDIYGERRMWRFQPFWLRIVLEERPDESNCLSIASHGRSLVIGDFLGPAMRRELAQSLRAALARWRAALNPASGAP